MRRRTARKLSIQVADPVAQAAARASRARRKGDRRGEVIALRQACLIREYDAALWTRLGDALFRCSKPQEALQAFKHALWLRERAGDDARAIVTRRLVDCATTGLPLRAAA